MVWCGATPSPRRCSAQSPPLGVNKTTTITRRGYSLLTYTKPPPSSNTNLQCAFGEKGGIRQQRSSLTPHASFVVHARPCRGKRWSLQAGRSSGFSSRSGVLAPTLSFCSHIHGGDPRHCKPARQARRCGLHPSPSSCCWIQSQVAGCPRNVHSRPRLRPGVFQSLPSRPPAVPLYPLLATLAFTSSYFKISFTPKVQLSSSSHTFPPLLVPPGRSKHFDAFTGNHPEHLGPGSSRRKLQLLCGR